MHNGGTTASPDSLFKSFKFKLERSQRSTGEVVTMCAQTATQEVRPPHRTFSGFGVIKGMRLQALLISYGGLESKRNFENKRQMPLA